MPDGQRIWAAMRGPARLFGIGLGALAIAVLFLAIFGVSPLLVLRQLFRALFSDLGSTLRWMTPLLLTALGAVVSFRAKIWNIGLDGQLYLGALGATWASHQLDGALPSIVAIPVILLIAAAAGSLWALIPAILRLAFGAPELLTTLVMNPIAILLTSYLVLFGPMRGGGMATATLSSDPISESHHLSRIMPPSLVTSGIFLAIGLAVIAHIWMRRATRGFELTLYGENPEFSIYAGVSNRRVYLESFLVSAALAGLAGAVEVLGVLHRFAARFNDSLGFDGIVVALIAGLTPIGAAIAALFFGALRVAGANLERFAGIPADMTDIVSAVVILGVAVAAGRTGLRLSRSAPMVVREDPTAESLTDSVASEGAG